MKALLFTCVLFLTFGFTTAGGGPKIKKKDDVVTVDGEPYFRHEWNKLVGCWEIKNIDGTKLMILRKESYYDPSAVSKSNPSGNRIYYSLILEGQTEVSCEPGSGTAKYLAKLFMEYTILDENGNVIPANLDKMAVAIGKTYSPKAAIIVR